VCPLVVGAHARGRRRRDVPREHPGVDHVTLVVGAAFAVTLLPFLLFVSYVLRVLTLAKRTLAIGPLVLRDSK